MQFFLGYPSQHQLAVRCEYQLSSHSPFRAKHRPAREPTARLSFLDNTAVTKVSRFFHQELSGEQLPPPSPGEPRCLE